MNKKLIKKINYKIVSWRVQRLKLWGSKWHPVWKYRRRDLILSYLQRNLKGSGLRSLAKTPICQRLKKKLWSRKATAMDSSTVFVTLFQTTTQCRSDPNTSGWWSCSQLLTMWAKTMSNCGKSGFHTREKSCWLFNAMSSCLTSLAMTGKALWLGKRIRSLNKYQNTSCPGLRMSCALSLARRPRTRILQFKLRWWTRVKPFSHTVSKLVVASHTLT